jgi:hypothetical protein
MRIYPSFPQFLQNNVGYSTSVRLQLLSSKFYPTTYSLIILQFDATQSASLNNSQKYTPLGVSIKIIEFFVCVFVNLKTLK